MRRTLGLIDYQRRDDGQFGYVQGDYTEAVADLFPKVMSAAKAVVSEWRGTLYFVYLPTGLGNLEDHAEVMRVVRDLDIPIIDLLPLFQAHSDPASLFLSVWSTNTSTKSAIVW